MGYSNLSPELRFVFLTLFPDQKPKAGGFSPKSYKHLLQAVRGLSPVEDPLAQILLDAWISLIESFYSKEFLSLNDLLLDKLQGQSDDPFEGNYLSFKSFIYGLRFSRDLVIERTFKDSGRGRRYFGALISKEPWHPEEMMEVNGFCQLDSKRHFNIHFEPQFNCLSGILNLYIHYEVNPYLTAKKIKSQIAQSKISGAQYEDYEKARKRFIEVLRSKQIVGLIIGGRTNQIASIPLRVTKKTTVSEAQRMICTTIDAISVHIDEILPAMTT